VLLSGHSSPPDAMDVDMMRVYVDGENYDYHIKGICDISHDNIKCDVYNLDLQIYSYFYLNEMRKAQTAE
jgi:hypothetical protein